MRVISGKYKGTYLDGFNIDGTRPTMDRVKESIFGSIQNNIKNSVCLDLFAGSGSLGIEALSNGALDCYFVDNNIKVINTLKTNLNKLGIKTNNVYYTNFKKALKKFRDEQIKFDVIFLDPPYKLNLINDSAKIIEEYDLLNSGGILVCEYETEQLNIDNLELIKSKRYGSTYVNIYKK